MGRPDSLSRRDEIQSNGVNCQKSATTKIKFNGDDYGILKTKFPL